MLTASLLNHHLKSIFRSRIWSGSSILSNLTVMILGLYLGLLSAFAGYYVGRQLNEAIRSGFIFTELGDSIETTFINYVSSIGLTLLISWFATRFFFQQSPVKNIRPYLVLPLSRRAVSNSLLVSSLFNFLNFLPILFLVPFTYFHIRPILGNSTSLFWFFSMILLTVFISNHVVTIFRLYLQRFPRITLTPVILGTVLIGIDIWARTGYLQKLSSFIFSPITSNAVIGFILIVLGVFLLLHILGVNLLMKDIYLDQGTAKVARASDSSGILAALERGGSISQFLALELKMMWRNKRTRQVLMISMFMLPLGVFYINQGRIKSDIVTAIGSLFVTGAFAFNYGQLMFGWESAHFDGLWARPMKMKSFIWAKLILLQISCLILGFISQPLILIFAPDRIVLFWSMLLFNMGLCCVVLVFVGLLNSKRIDIDRSTLLNYQGTGIQHYVFMLPVMILPLIILKFSGKYAIGILALVGIFFLLLNPLWVRIMNGLFMRRRHKMLAGFRKQ